MGQKNLAEKQFLSFEDVFADIFNSIVLKQDLIDPKKLRDTKTETQLSDLGNDLHAQLRDVVRLALFGIENQTRSDRLMAARIMAYNATVIIDQLKSKDRPQFLYPILTIVLYFGKEKWMDQLDGDYLEKFLEIMTKDNKKAGAEMGSYLGKILGAVRVMIKYKVQPDEIRKNIREDYPDFDQSKLDDIIAEQKKELGIS